MDSGDVECDVSDGQNCLMATRRKSRIRALIVAHVSALALLLVLTKGHTWPSPGSVVFAGIVWAQLSLLALWMLLSRRRLVVRLAVFVPAIAILAGGQAVQTGVSLLMWRGFAMYMSIMILLTTACISWPLLALRRRQIGLVFTGTEATASDQAGLRFSLLHLFGWMSFVAVFLALARIVRPLFETPSLGGMLVALPIHAISHAAIALMAIWAGLGDGHSHQRFSVVVWVALIAGVINAFCVATDRASSIAILSALVLTSLTTFGSLLICRAAGYRLGRIATETEA